ncbi:MAG: RNA methyltransferase [Chloroflexi bacterium]|nr:RNA methyltransferase [Chloroflexota bacterium]
MIEPISFSTQECSDRHCRFRFPIMVGSAIVNTCPKCNAPIKTVGTPYTRHVVGNGGQETRTNDMQVLLDNVRSLYNVGSIFRTAEAVGFRQIHLCGMTPTPDNPRLEKTAIGAQHMIPWQYSNNGLKRAQYLKNQGFGLWAIEGGARAKPLFESSPPPENQPIVLVIGNELAGVDPDILAICERVLYIPMGGSKESLNVTVAFGIAAYFLRYPQHFG